MTNREMERRLINIESMVSEIYASATGKPAIVRDPTKADMDRFCKAILRKDKTAQQRHLERFGDRPPAGA